MRSFFGKLLLLAALGAATWLVVLWRWYALQRVVTPQDAALYLLALPLALFAFVLALRWAARRGAASAQAAATAAGAARAARTAQATPAQPEEPDAWPLLGAWVHTPAGADAEALLSALAEGAPRPAPDAGLRDADGLPVLSARIAALDVAAIETALAAGTPAQKPAPTVLRALAALAPLIDQALEPLREAPGASAAPAASPSKTALPRLHVLVAWPEAWSASEAEAAEGWLKARLQALAAALELPSPWVLQPVSGGGVALMREATRLLGDMRQQNPDGAVLALACHSDLDDEAVQRLERAQRLFVLPKRPQGVMPGEAAAALLLASRCRVKGGAAPGTGITLHGLQTAQREAASTNSERKAALAGTEALLAQSLADAGLEPAGVSSVACDAAQHADAAARLYALAQAALPHLEPLADLRLVGTLCGHTGAVGPLLALALASMQCRLHGGPALAVALSEASWSMVGTLLPRPSPASMPAGDSGG